MDASKLNWILLRGWGLESRHWLNFPRVMSEALGGQVHCLDLPGFGTEAKRQSPVTVSAMTDDLRARFVKLDPSPRRWACLGHSLGGMVAMDWAKRYPRDFEKVVLINTSGKDLAPMHARLSVFGIYCILRSLLAQDTREGQRQILKLISNEKRNDPAIVDKYTDIARTAPVRLDKVTRQAVAASQFIAPVRIEPETLILASLKDKMVDVRCSKMLAERFQCKIKFHGTAGHDLTLDDPEWTIECLREFIDETRLVQQT